MRIQNARRQLEGCVYGYFVESDLTAVSKMALSNRLEVLGRPVSAKAAATGSKSNAPNSGQ